MAIALTGSITQLTQSPSGKTWAWSVSIPSDASMAVLCYSCNNSGRQIASADINGTALSVGVKRDYASSSSNEMWILVNPPTGDVTLTMTISPTAYDSRPVALFCLKGTDTSASPIRSTGTGVGNNDPVTGNMTGVAGDWGVCLIHSGSISTTITATDGGNQTLIGNIKGSSGTCQFSTAYKSISADSSTITMTGNITGGVAGAIIAMIVKPAASLSPPPNLILPNRFRTHLVR